MATRTTTQQQGNAASQSNDVNNVIIPELPSAYSADYGRKLGAAQAAVTSLNEQIAKDLLTFFPKFGLPDETLSDEVKADLFDGYTDRFAAKNPGQLYMVTHPAGAQFCDLTPISQEQYEGLQAKYDAAKKAGKEPAPLEVIDMTAHVAMSFTQHQINFLHLRPAGGAGLCGPVYKGTVTDLRDRVKRFHSQCFKALENAAKNIQQRRLESLGQTRTRTAVEFATKIENLIGSAAKGSLLQECKTKADKKDPTADLARFEKARAAFLAVWLAK